LGRQPLLRKKFGVSDMREREEKGVSADQQVVKTLGGQHKLPAVHRGSKLQNEKKVVIRIKL
jgi:hypothetical protein